MTVNTQHIVTIAAYMIGIKKSMLEDMFSGDIENLKQLYSDRDATIIRNLSKMRTSLMLNFKKTDTEIKYNMKNLDKLDWFDKEDIKQLSDYGIKIIHSNYNAQKYTELVNKYINENIGNCQRLFPEWVNWNYIKDLFAIPGYTKNDTLKKEFAKYMANIEYYPFQQYVHWKPSDCGGILYNDKKFLSFIYAQHGDIFIGKSKYIDADETVKERIYNFIKDTDRAEIVVDCENSDVYKLCSVITSLDADELSKINKIILIDDVNTNCGWRILEKFVKIPVEYILVDRIKDNKSLVDIKMTACVCTEHYKNSVSSFILLSSDSDYWGLMSSLPDAKFLVMFEYSKVSEAIKKTLTEHDIFCCAIDDFYSGRIEEFKKLVLFDILKQYLPDILSLNGRELVSKIYEEARIDANDKEMEYFFKKYIQTLKLVIDDDGNISVKINT